MGGDPGRPPASPYRPVHRPVIRHEFQLVQPAASPALHQEDLGAGVELEAVDSSASATVGLAPHLTVLGSQGVHLRPSPELYLGYQTVQVDFSSVSPQAAPVT